jgi:hypothetical protein
MRLGRVHENVRQYEHRHGGADIQQQCHHRRRDQRKSQTGCAFDESGEQKRRADEHMREIESHEIERRNPTKR